MGRVVIPGFRKIETSGGGEGETTNYNDLTNKPSINNVPLVGNLNTVNFKLTDSTLTEEGVPAEAKTVGQKLEEHSTSLTALSEQLGNHTVKSDVPENAVFTDTVYDDAEVQKRISDNGYGEVAGGKNLLPKINLHTTYKGVTLNTNKDGSLSLSGTVTGQWSKFPLLDTTLDAGTYTFGLTVHKAKTYLELYLNTDSSPTGISSTESISFTLDKSTRVRILYSWDNVTFNDVIYPQLEEGLVATSYEPYFPSNKMLAEENSQQSTEMMDIKRKQTVNMLFLPTEQKVFVNNGITCRIYATGSCYLSGTATSDASFKLWGSFFDGVDYNYRKYKVVGAPKGASESTFCLQLTNADAVNKIIGSDYGNGFTFIPSEDIVAPTPEPGLPPAGIGRSYVTIFVKSGQTLNNVQFKPMVTTNLNATYDDFVPYTGDTGRLNWDVAELKNDLSKLQDNVDSSDIQYSAYIKNANGDITPSAITSSPKISEVVSQINNNIGVLLQGHNEQKSKLDNISIDTIDRERGEITFKGIDFSAELKLLKIGNQLELLRGNIYTVGNFFSVTSGDVLSFYLSVSEFGDYIKGLKLTSKLAFSGQGIFASKVIGMLEIREYTSSNGDKGVSVRLIFNDSYEFSSANVRSGIVQFDF